MKTLESVTEFVRNGASIKQSSETTGIPITRIETISNDIFNYDKLGYANIFDDTYSKYYLEDEDVLLSHINSEKFLGRTVVYIKKINEPIIHGMNLLCIRFNKNQYSPKFFSYYSKSQRAKLYFSQHTKRAVNQASIASSAIKCMPIPDLDLTRQNEIVDDLEKIQSAISLKVQELNDFSDLVKSRFIEMFEGKNYPTLFWNDIFITKTGKLDSNAMVENGKYPFFTCAKEIFSIDKYAFDQEALLLAGNNAAGKYDVKYYKGKFNAYQRTYVLSLKNDWSYQLFRFQLEDKLEFLREQSKGCNTKFITLKLLSSLEFIVPPMNLQIEFENFVKLIDKSKFIVQKQIKDLQELLDSKMDEYFG